MGILDNYFGFDNEEATKISDSNSAFDARDKILQEYDSVINSQSYRDGSHGWTDENKKRYRDYVRDTVANLGEFGNQITQQNIAEADYEDTKRREQLANDTWEALKSGEGADWTGDEAWNAAINTSANMVGAALTDLGKNAYEYNVNVPQTMLALGAQTIGAVADDDKDGWWHQQARNLADNVLNARENAQNIMGASEFTLDSVADTARASANAVSNLAALFGSIPNVVGGKVIGAAASGLGRITGATKFFEKMYGLADSAALAEKGIAWSTAEALATKGRDMMINASRLNAVSGLDYAKGLLGLASGKLASAAPTWATMSLPELYSDYLTYDEMGNVVLPEDRKILSIGLAAIPHAIIENMDLNPQKFGEAAEKMAFEKSAWNWFKSAIGEGNEEVFQDWIQAIEKEYGQKDPVTGKVNGWTDAIGKVAYDLSTNKDNVLGDQLQEWLAGAVGGAVMGAADKGFGYSKKYLKMHESYRNRLNAIAQGLDKEAKAMESMGIADFSALRSAQKEVNAIGARIKELDDKINSNKYKSEDERKTDIMNKATLEAEADYLSATLANAAEAAANDYQSGLTILEQMQSDYNGQVEQQKQNAQSVIDSMAQTPYGYAQNMPEAQAASEALNNPQTMEDAAQSGNFSTEQYQPQIDEAIKTFKTDEQINREWEAAHPKEAADIKAEVKQRRQAYEAEKKKAIDEELAKPAVAPRTQSELDEAFDEYDKSSFEGNFNDYLRAKDEEDVAMQKEAEVEAEKQQKSGMTFEEWEKNYPAPKGFKWSKNEQNSWVLEKVKESESQESEPSEAMKSESDNLSEEAFKAPERKGKSTKVGSKTVYETKKDAMVAAADMLEQGKKSGKIAGNAKVKDTYTISKTKFGYVVKDKKFRTKTIDGKNTVDKGKAQKKIDEVNKNLTKKKGKGGKKIRVELVEDQSQLSDEDLPFSIKANPFTGVYEKSKTVAEGSTDTNGDEIVVRIVRNNIESEQRLDEVLAHEILHAGIRFVLNKSQRSYLLQQVDRLIKSDKAFAADVMPTISDYWTAGRNVQLEEVLARLAEKVDAYEDSGIRKIWNKIVSVIYKGLRKLGLTTSLHKSELADIIKGLRNDLSQTGDLFNYTKGMMGSKASAKAMFRADNMQKALTKLSKGKELFTYDINDGKPLASLKTWDKGGRSILWNYLKQCLKAGEIGFDDAKAIIYEMDAIYDACQSMKEKFPQFSQWSDTGVTYDEQGKPHFTVVRKNGDYAMNIDFSTVCKKRRPLNNVLNEMVKRGMLNEHGTLEAEDFASIQKIIKEKGFEVACALCFVDSRRYNIGQQAKNICMKWNKMLDLYNNDRTSFDGILSGKLKIDYENNKIIPNTSKKKADNDEESSGGMKHEKIAGNAIKNNEKYRFQLTEDWLVSSGSKEMIGGHDYLAKNYPAIFQIVHQYSAGQPKESHSDVAWNNDIINSFAALNNSDATVFDAVKAFAIGGVRLQSFSDYVPTMFFDYCQCISELAAKGLPAHCYTKEEAFVRLFGQCGIKTNMSLVYGNEGVIEISKAEYNRILNDKNKGEAYVATLKGKYYKYDFADETFNPKRAIELRKDPRFKYNCGTIAVAISNLHAEVLLADPNIDMVIPYHASGMKQEIAKVKGIDKYNDYTNFQHHGVLTRPRDDGSYVAWNNKESRKAFEDAYFEKYGKKFEDYDFYDKLNNKKYEGTTYHNPRAVAKDYLKWCADSGLSPKYNMFQDNDNYYKLLVDFRVYDDEGNYQPQQAVKMNLTDDYQDVLRESLTVDQKTASKFNDEIEDMLKECQSALRSNKLRRESNYTSDSIFKNLLTGKKLSTSMAMAGMDKVKGTKSKVIKNSKKFGYAKVKPMGLSKKERDKITKAKSKKNNTMFSLKTTVAERLREDLGMAIPDNSDMREQYKEGYIDSYPEQLRIYDYITADGENVADIDSLLESRQSSPESQYTLNKMAKQFAAAFPGKVGRRLAENCQMLRRSLQKNSISKKELNAVTIDDILKSPVQDIFAYGNYADTEDEKKYEDYVRSSRDYAEEQKTVAEEGRQIHDKNRHRYQSLDSLMKDVEAGHVRFSLKTAITADSEYQKKTSATMFSGGGLIESGLVGVIDPKAALEFKQNIADVYTDNYGNHMIVGSVENKADLEKLYKQVDGHVDFFHASPVCHNYSQAKVNREETQLDITTAKATAEAIERLQPQHFTLENAPLYRKSKALKNITDVLNKNGYVWNMNVYHHDRLGGATKRTRLILVASKDGYLPLIDEGYKGNFKSWYSVTSDLLKQAPSHEKFTDRQNELFNNTFIKGLPLLEYVRKNNEYVWVSGNGHGKWRASAQNEPAPTITANGASEEFIIKPNGTAIEVTPRMVARVMGLPDEYDLPESKTLAHTILGNGVPTEMTKAVIKPILTAGQPMFSLKSTDTRLDGQQWQQDELVTEYPETAKIISKINYYKKNPESIDAKTKLPLLYSKLGKMAKNMEDKLARSIAEDIVFNNTERFKDHSRKFSPEKGFDYIPRTLAMMAEDVTNIKTGYENVPDSLLGFSRSDRPQKGYDEQKYKYVLDYYYSVDNGKTWNKDSIKGMNKKQAIERARRDLPEALIRIPSKSDARFSLKTSEQLDSKYLAAVEEYKKNGSKDASKLQQMVDEAAEKAFKDSKIRDKNNKLVLMYHGTNAEFNEFEFTDGGKNGTAEGFGIYLSDSPEVAKQYGNRTIKAYANVTRPASSERKTISRAELVKLIKATCEEEVRHDKEAYGDDLDIRDSWISNYTNTYEMPLSVAYRKVADSILDMNSNDMDIIQEILSGMGIRNYENAERIHRIVTDVTGIDGYETYWNNNNKKTRIVLAFQSNQVKQADPITYGDAGNVISLSKRFDRSNKDIRFSLVNPEAVIPYAQSNIDKLNEEIGLLIAQNEEYFNGNKKMNALTVRSRQKKIKELLQKRLEWDRELRHADETLKRQKKDIRYSLVTNKSTIDMLEASKKTYAYRAMVMIDGKLYPPMATKWKEEGEKFKKLTGEQQIGKWYQSDERPEKIKKFKIGKDGKKYGMVTITKDNGDSLEVAYNPYFHSSLTPLNDQFSSAYKRPNLVVVRVELADTDLNSGYRANYSKDPVGKTQWKAGTVATKLAKLGKPSRKVFLSQYCKIVEIMKDSEVASMIAEMMEGTGLDIPENVVTPSLLKELKKLNVRIGTAEKNNESQDIRYSLRGNNTPKKSLQQQYKDQLADAAKRIAEKAAKEQADNAKGIKARASDYIDRAEYNWADRRLYLRKWLQNLTETLSSSPALASIFDNGKIRDDLDVGMLWDTVDGKIQNNRDEFTEKYWNPFYDLATENKVTYEDLNRYLFARHAEERDAYIASINPEFANGGHGSGWDDSWGTPAEEKKRLEKKYGYQLMRDIGVKYDEMTQALVDKQLEYHLIGKTTADMLKNRYKHYVPLKRFDDAERHGYDQNPAEININQKLNARAYGRNSEPEHMLTFAKANIDTVFRRGERNLIKLAMVQLATKIGDNNIEVNRQLITRTLDKDGDVTYVVDRSKDAKDQTIFARSNDATYSVTFHNKELYNAFISDDMTSGLIQSIVHGLRGITGIMGSNATSRNIEFGLVNLTKDQQQALSENLVYRGNGKTWYDFAVSAIKNIPAAAKTFLKHSVLKSDLAKQYGVKVQPDADTRMFEEFLKYGGTTGYIDIYRLTDDARKLEQQMDEKTMTFLQRWDKWKKEGRLTEKAKAQAEEWIAKVMAPLEFINDLFEQTTRFSNYRAARQAGLSPARAAELSKNLTLNFNRHGALWTSKFNWAYMFSNASLQGTNKTLRMYQKAFSKKATPSEKKAARYILTLSLGAGIMSQILARAMSGDDDKDKLKYYDKLDASIKDNNMVIMLGGNSYVKIPLFVGAAFPYMMGRNATALMDGTQSIGESVTNIVQNMTDYFSPLGTAADNKEGHGSIVKSIMPTAMRPFLDVSYNSNFAGSRIYAASYNSTKPAHTRAFKKTPEFYVGLSRLLNRMTGGNNVEKGYMDIPPEAIQHIVESYLGGTGKFFGRGYDTFAKIISGETPDLGNVPFVRRFADNVGDAYVYDEFKQNEALYSTLTAAKESEDEEVLGKYPNYKKFLRKMKEHKHRINSAKDSDRLDRIKEANAALRELKK